MLTGTRGHCWPRELSRGRPIRQALTAIVPWERAGLVDVGGPKVPEGDPERDHSEVTVTDDAVLQCHE